MTAFNLRGNEHYTRNIISMKITSAVLFHSYQKYKHNIFTIDYFILLDPSAFLGPDIIAIFDLREEHTICIRRIQIAFVMNGILTATDMLTYPNQKTTQLIRAMVIKFDRIIVFVTDDNT
jgi:hypothetical protein